MPESRRRCPIVGLRAAWRGVQGSAAEAGRLLGELGGTLSPNDSAGLRASGDSGQAADLMLVGAAYGPAHVISRAEWLSAACAHAPAGVQFVAFQINVRGQEVLFGFLRSVSRLLGGQRNVGIPRRVVHSRRPVIWHCRLVR